MSMNTDPPLLCPHGVDQRLRTETTLEHAEMRVRFFQDECLKCTAERGLIVLLPIEGCRL